MTAQNLPPIVMPTMAIALVRWLSRVESATNALTAAEMAPAPCKPRPIVTPSKSSALAAIKLPMANSARPNTMTGFRPKRSEAAPSGSCNSA